MNNKVKTIELPSLLSFERKLETSDALMYSGSWGQDPTNEKDWKMIRITKRQNRSTISAHGTKDDDKTKPNPVSSDSDDANLPDGKDTLKVSFTLRVVGNVGSPFACNEPSFEDAISTKVVESKEKTLKELANRYASNIANGRFLWRNRVGADEISISVVSKELTQSIVFSAYDFLLKDFTLAETNEDLNKLAEIIYKGLVGETCFTLLEIDAYVKLGNKQHVFPSQEMNMNAKGKVLFQLENCAAMHNVKIGNAIRTVDDWYKVDGMDAEFPIAIEPFGAVTQKGQAYRKSKNDLYTLMLNWVNDKEVSDNDKAYVVANLIRGGVFSRKSSK
ncbi:MAG: type I-F CRISPR-associated protein Csy3 [Aliivibrio sp.]|uniref:type I-F CRISPR-associated protein Csy3 n=1 Tax=Aliivibrio sp. TaxID=1872443 RepID=UPI001A42A1F6|nr:type I-F CRISPR-associated protein Csy3 [Aliivibrio sp.]